MTSVAQTGRSLVPVLCLLALVGQVGSFLYLPALPTIGLEFAASEGGLQGTVVSFLLGSLLGFALIGPLSDRHGRSEILSIAGMIFVAGCIGSALAPNLGTLIAARFVQGIGSVAGIITARTVIRDSFAPAEAVRLISYVSAANAASVAASPILGAFLLTLVGWRAGFWLAAAFAAAITLIGVAMLPRSERRPAGPTLASAWRILASPVWRASLLIAAGTNAAFLVMMAASPFVFIVLLDRSPVAYSWIMAGILSTFGVAAARSGRLAGRLGPKQVMRLAIGPMMLGAFGLLLGALLWPDVWVVALPLALMVGAMGVLVPSAHMAMMAPFPDLAGTATSYGMLATTTFGAFAVWLYSQTLAGSVVGFGGAITAMAALSALGWALLPSTEHAG